MSGKGKAVAEFCDWDEIACDGKKFVEALFEILIMVVLAPVIALIVVPGLIVRAVSWPWRGNR